MKRIISFVIATAILCLVGFFTVTPAQTPTPTPQKDEISAFQRTDTIDKDLILRAVSDDGKRFVFESTGDLTGNNGDVNQEIFLFDVDTRTLTQITDTKDVLVDPNDTTMGVDIHVTNNSPVISGDGTTIVFTSNSGTIAGTNDDGNQEIFLARVPRGSTTVTFQRITDTPGQKELADNYTPSISRNGGVIAFVSTKDIPANNTSATINNADGNGEIYLWIAATNTFFQVTSKLDSEGSPDGINLRGFNAAPYLSGNGNVLAFISAFNYVPDGQTPDNKDFNGEIFLYRIGDAANTVTQVTNTTTTDVIAAGQTVNLMTLSARHLSNDGSLLVFESSGNFAGNNSDKSREVYLYKTTESDRTKAFIQLTDQRLPASPTLADLVALDQNFLPCINGSGTFVTLGSVRKLSDLTTLTVDATTSNDDGSREVLRVDISDLSSLKIRQMTFTQPSGRFLDERENTPVSWPDDTGNLVTFHTAGDVTGVNVDRTFEIFQVLVRPVTTINESAATLVNAASFAPAPTDPAGSLTTIAQGATGAIFGTQLANSTTIAQSVDLPFELSGVTVTVAGVAARLIFVSPGQINFQFPPGIIPADSVEFTVNNNGVLSKGNVKVVAVAPGIFTVTSAGTGAAAAQCLAIVNDGVNDVAVYSNPACEISTGDIQDRFLIIYGTGWRNTSSGTVTVQVQGDTGDPVTVTANYIGVQPTFALAGLDQINAVLPKDLIKGTLKLTVLGPTGNSQADVTIELK